MKKDGTLERSFGGKIKDFENKDEQKLEIKHLKAYKRGDTRYKIGLDLYKKPIYLPVNEIWS